MERTKIQLVEEVRDLQQKLTAFKRHDDGAPDGSFPVSNSTDHETLYRTIYESTAVGICMTDLAGRITQCNEAYQKMLGYSADELTKLNFRDLTLPEDLPNNVALIEQLVAGERERIDIQKRYLRKDSSICWVEMNVSLLRNSAGEIYATLTVAHDVTERKIAEQTRDISEENYRNLFDNAHDSIFVLNPNDLTFVDVNENAAIRLGYTRDELRQLRLPDICPPGSEARMSKLLRQIRDQGEIRFEATHVRKDGTPMPVEIASRRVEFNGRFVLQSIVRDISERKQAEQARDSSQEKYKSLFNNAHDSIFVIDPADLSFIDVNDNAARRLGYTRDELRQLNLADIKRPESAAIAHDSVQRDISSGENKFEAVHVRKDGTHMPVDVATRRLEIDGRFVLQSIVRDISERKVAEKALRGSESRFRSLFEDAVIGIAIADDEGRMVQVNPAWSNMLGYGLDEMVGMKWPAVSHPDDIAENRHLSDDLFRGERSNYQLEKRYVRKDGKILWARLTVSLLDDDLTTDRLTLAMIEDITEHKKVEIALSDSRSLLEHAQQMARFGSLDIDYDSDIVTWSDEVYRMIGVARSDYDGRPSSYLEFVHPDEREWVAQQAEALRNGKDMEYTYRMIRTDGEERIVHVRGMVTRFVDGVPRQARGFIQDITELKEKENALRESEARLMEAQQLAQIGSWTWDIARDLIYWSAEHFRIFGRDPDGSESSYDEFLAMLHIDDREAVTAAVDVAIRSLGSYEFEYRFVRPDGEVRVAHAMGTVEADEAGKPIRMLGTVQDITERKNAAEAIAESEAHLNQAQRIAHIGSWEFNAHTEQLTWSDEVYRTFGVQPKEFRPTIKGYLDCVHPDDRDDLIRNIKNSAEGAGETTNNYRIVRPNGEIRSIREVTVVHTDADRKLIRRAGTVQDITEQVNTEEQLRQAQKMEAVGQLTGGVAHDFNNLLTVILGNLELIGERVDADAAVRGLIERAIKASERGASLTHQLLSYSRKQTLLPTNIDLGQLATGMTEMLSRTLGVAIEIRTRGQTSLWR